MSQLSVWTCMHTIAPRVEPSSSSRDWEMAKSEHLWVEDPESSWPRIEQRSRCGNFYWISAYKECWAGRCSSDDILSPDSHRGHGGGRRLSGDLAACFKDGIAAGTYGAMEKGVFAVCSAGKREVASQAGATPLVYILPLPQRRTTRRARAGSPWPTRSSRPGSLCSAVNPLPESIACFSLNHWSTNKSQEKK